MVLVVWGFGVLLHKYLSLRCGVSLQDREAVAHYRDVETVASVSEVCEYLIQICFALMLLTEPCLLGMEWATTCRNSSQLSVPFDTQGDEREAKTSQCLREDRMIGDLQKRLQTRFMGNKEGTIGKVPFGDYAFEYCIPFSTRFAESKEII